VVLGTPLRTVVGRGTATAAIRLTITTTLGFV